MQPPGCHEGLVRRVWPGPNPVSSPGREERHLGVGLRQGLCAGRGAAEGLGSENRHLPLATPKPHWFLFSFFGLWKPQVMPGTLLWCNGSVLEGWGLFASLWGPLACLCPLCKWLCSCLSPLPTLWASQLLIPSGSLSIPSVAGTCWISFPLFHIKACSWVS